jgi:hypothetical protein
MSTGTTWLAERTASLLPKTSNPASGCTCSAFYYGSECVGGYIWEYVECVPCHISYTKTGTKC